MEIRIDLEEIVGDIVNETTYDPYDGPVQGVTFKEAVRNQIVSEASRRIKEAIMADISREVGRLVNETTRKFIDQELQGIVQRKLRSGELLYSNAGFNKIDDLIQKSINANSIDTAIRKHIEQQTNAFVKDLKLQYNNVFAAKVVQSLAENKMLSPDIAQLLLGQQIAEQP